MPSAGDGRLSARTELHALVEAFPDVGFIIDADGQYVEVLSSPATETLLYEDPEVLVGSTIEEVFADDIAATFMENIRAAIDSGEVQEFQYQLDVPDGLRWFEARVAPVGDASNHDEDKKSYVVYVARDVTEARHTQRELARQRSYMHAMLDSLDDVFYVLDREGQLVDWNQTVERVSGYDGEELSECALVEIFGERARERLAAFVETVFEEGSARRVAEVETKSGAEMPYEFAASLFDDPAGEELVVGIGRDVSERIEREEQVRVFGRVLRHNMRNKMTVVNGTAEAIEQKGAAEGRSAEVDRIRQASHELMRLTEKAHDATEILLKQTEPVTVDIDGAAREILARHRTGYPDADFSYDGSSDATATAIPAIRFALSELVENAVEHGTDGPPSVRVTVECRDDVVVATVSDDGPGLPPHEANIITEEREMSPLYHASGIGLWLVRWIVKRSRGEVSITDDGDGTTVAVELSRATDSGQPTDAGPNSDAIPF